MKIMWAMASLFWVTAHAEENLSVSILKATKIELTALMPEECPPELACEASVRLDVTYTALGCLDDIVVSASEDEKLTPQYKRRFNLSGVNIHNPESQSALCKTMPTKKVGFFLGMGFASENDVEVVELTKILNKIETTNKSD